ncbi:MAG: PhnD/SsuA/transferrin family substrate-binding protein, partial [Duodenibacillus sp.]|nr:PhnD/SsuA/transferrin family substrate-binding protein [Duodenibacillus sp.]
TLQTIREVAAPRPVEVRSYSPGELDKESLRDGAQFVIASSGYYRRTNLKTGQRELMSIASAAYPDANHTDGAAIVARADRDDLNAVADARGLTLVANAPFTFTGFIVPSGEVAAAGFDPESFYVERVFKGEGVTMPAVAVDVLEGRADVGYLRLCMLERLEREGIVPRGALKVLAEKTRPGEACRRSTPLYPGWTLSTTPRADGAFAERVMRALLRQAPAERGLRWGVATNYQAVDDLYRELKLGPYAYLRQWTVERFVQEHWLLAVMVNVAMAALAAAAAGAALLARKRTRQLRVAMRREERAARRSRWISERIEALQKVWAVGQLSSTLAHELRQPLTSIVCLARGLVRFMERGELGEEQLKDALATMSEQAARASAVVDKVRAYAKSPVGTRERLDLKRVIEQCIGQQRMIRRERMQCVWHDLAEAEVMGDAVELGLVFTNLVKNALEAVEGVERPGIAVTLAADEGWAVASVIDNGPALTEAAFEALAMPFRTSKSEGLGLGLSIAKTIIESHGGSMRFSRNLPSGLAIEVRLPLAAGGEAA